MYIDNMISLFGNPTSFKCLLQHEILKSFRTVADGFTRKIIVGYHKKYKNKLKLLNFEIKYLK